MNSSAKWVVGIIIAVIIIGGGAFAIFHKSSNPPATTSNNTSGQTSNTPAVNNAVVVTKTDPKLGQYLADPSGRALYTYNADTSGVSNCTGSCLSNWPAYTATSSAANLPTNVGTITRTDNHQVQYTYKGLPLYYFTSDTSGQVTGNGVENFAVAKPAAAASSTQSTPAQNNTTSGSPY